MIVLKKPVITEKTMTLAKSGMFTFIVDKKARKDVIAQAVKEAFKVDVKSVKVSHYKDQKKMQRRVRSYFIFNGFKKAVVELKKGQTIALFQPEEASQAKVINADSEPQVKETKSRLKGTKVKVEKAATKGTKEAKVAKEKKGAKVVPGK